MFLFRSLLFLQLAALGHNIPEIDSSKIESTLSFISDDRMEGRATGSVGSEMVSSFLRGRLKEMGMVPFYSTTFTQSFKIEQGEESLIGRNIIGVLPSLYYSDKYLILSAHYDHLGVLDGKIYNGADDNASGVTALLTIAQWLSQMRYNREGPRVNIIFAFFDGKESSMAGSSYFAENLKIAPSKINYNINLDQLGCTFAPWNEEENYLLYVADGKIRGEMERRVEHLNRFHELSLAIDHTFYNSPTFYKLFLITGDHYNLSQKGIPSMLFTSGINMHTYKPTDQFYFINYPVFINRIRLIYHLVEQLVNY